MPMSKNTELPKEVARRRISLAVEALSNIHYLIERSCDDPVTVKGFLEMAAPSMAVLRELALQGDVSSGPHTAEPPNHPPDSPEADRIDSLPLAAAGEEAALSIGDASPEIRVDRLEAD
jgi:hypothetical protein